MALPDGPIAIRAEGHLAGHVKAFVIQGKVVEAQVDVVAGHAAVAVTVLAVPVILIVGKNLVPLRAASHALVDSKGPTKLLRVAAPKVGADNGHVHEPRLPAETENIVKGGFFFNSWKHPRMMRLVGLAAALCLLVLGYYTYQDWYGFRHPAGVLCPDEPRQRNLEKADKIHKGEFLITPLAEFEMTGRVLATESFFFERGSDLSPVDLTLGWGPLSDTALLEKIAFHHSDRYCSWETSDPSVDLAAVKTHSSNMHFCPADAAVASTLRRVRREDIVHFKGFLIKAEATDGWHWVSSLNRTDSGTGACELVWVTELTRY